MKKLLYLTDLSYQAKGRNYCEEDIYITVEEGQYLYLAGTFAYAAEPDEIPGEEEPDEPEEETEPTEEEGEAI